ncbi:uncharacterized protein TNCV_3108121 [Trichonephila clavipes]|uniref:Uncharacterized protein n=1 Tax=Trichonephila clavipes TaxID=2585209 RepID=A0A8X6S7C8_TRICX|nr:uncharacterized protein TNCV_3108121 [Trichonephila clavipes]
MFTPVVFKAIIGVSRRGSEKFRALHTEEAFNGLFDFSIAPKAPSGEILLQSQKQMKVTCYTGLLATDHVILNHGQVTWTTPEMAPPLLTTTPHPREDVSAFDRFSVHRFPERRVFSGTGVELMTCLP